MARYEGMQDIVDGLRERLRQEIELEAPASTTSSDDSIWAADRMMSAKDRLKHLLSEVHDLREQLSADKVHKMSPREQEETLELLSEVLHELWRCEATLQGVAPID